MVDRVPECPAFMKQSKTYELFTVFRDEFVLGMAHPSNRPRQIGRILANLREAVVKNGETPR